MKNFLKLIFAISIISLTVTQVSAQTLSYTTAKNEIEKLIQNDTQKYIKEDVEAKVIGLRFNELILPEGEISYKLEKKDEGKFFPRTVKPVTIYIDGKVNRTLNVPVEIKVYKEVLVASGQINRDQNINKEVATVKRMNVADRLDYYLSPEMLNKEMSAKKMFKEGEFIDKRFVKVKPDVVQNSEVRVFFVSNDAVMITIDATALSDWLVGDYIKVSNKKYNKVYTGKIVGENRVMVQI